MKFTVQFLFVVVCLIPIDYFIATPIIEYLSGTKIEFCSLLWFADVFLLVPVAAFLHNVYDKYIEKWIL